MNFVPLNQVEAAREAVCPTNGRTGTRVDAQTLKAMLKIPLDVLRRVEYRFCSDPNCPTVYYSADGLQTFAETDLRERVYQKHPQDADIFVCYCFRHTVEDLLLEGKRVAAQITHGIKNEQCACDIRNPQGSCCFGNVNSIVKRFAAGQ
jgi:hypothetical protein